MLFSIKYITAQLYHKHSSIILCFTIQGITWYLQLAVYMVVYNKTIMGLCRHGYITEAKQFSDCTLNLKAIDPGSAFLTFLARFPLCQLCACIWVEPAPLTGSFKDLLHLVQFLAETAGGKGGRWWALCKDPRVRAWQNGFGSNFGIGWSN